MLIPFSPGMIDLEALKNLKPPVDGAGNCLWCADSYPEFCSHHRGPRMGDIEGEAVDITDKAKYALPPPTEEKAP